MDGEARLSSQLPDDRPETLVVRTSRSGVRWVFRSPASHVSLEPCLDAQFDDVVYLNEAQPTITVGATEEAPKVSGGLKVYRCSKSMKRMAPQVGLEPTTLRLTGGEEPFSSDCPEQP